LKIQLSTAGDTDSLASSDVTISILLCIGIAWH